MAFSHLKTVDLPRQARDKPRKHGGNGVLLLVGDGETCSAWRDVCFAVVRKSPRSPPCYSYIHIETIKKLPRQARDKRKES